MHYTKIDQQIKKLSKCLIKTSTGIKKLNRLVIKQGQKIITIPMPGYAPVLGEDKSPYQSGTLVFGGRGILYKDSTKAHTFTVPSGVNKIHMVVIGAGGSGARGSYEGSGGGGGGLAAVNNVAVVPGDELIITVGKGGDDRTTNIDGEDGGESLIASYIRATGGKKGKDKLGGDGGYGEQIANTLTNVVIGTGGKGGQAKDGGTDGAGGGGAAGYGGHGGDGGGVDGNGTGDSDGTNGQKGGGGGGGSAQDGGVGGFGGGVAPFGLGIDGAGADNSDTKTGNNGKPGSVADSYSGYVYGGGSGGADASGNSSAGQDGAVLICWDEPLLLESTS